MATLLSTLMADDYWGGPVYGGRFRIRFPAPKTVP